MELLRIGDKLLSKRRIAAAIDRILDLRMKGHSQQEVADQLGIDRTFVSRLEALGEVRKGGRVALIGFPLANVEDVRAMAEAEGVEFVLLLNDQERWDFVTDLPGAELVNRLMDWLSTLQQYDAVIFIASQMRIEAAEAVLGSEIVIGYSLGPSPIQGDRAVDVEAVRKIVRSVKSSSASMA